MAAAQRRRRRLQQPLHPALPSAHPLPLYQGPCSGKGGDAHPLAPAQHSEVGSRHSPALGLRQGWGSEPQGKAGVRLLQDRLPLPPESSRKHKRKERRRSCPGPATTQSRGFGTVTGRFSCEAADRTLGQPHGGTAPSMRPAWHWQGHHFSLVPSCQDTG